MTTAKPNDIAKRADPHVKKIESLNEDIESEKSRFMSYCKARRKLIKEVYKSGKDDGIPVAALKGVVEARKLQKKLDKIGGDFDMDESAAYRALADAFGPLGMAAAVRAGYAPNGDGQERTPTAAEAKAAQQQKDHEAGLSTVGRGPVATS